MNKIKTSSNFFKRIEFLNFENINHVFHSGNKNVVPHIFYCDNGKTEYYDFQGNLIS